MSAERLVLDVATLFVVAPILETTQMYINNWSTYKLWYNLYKNTTQQQKAMNY